MPVASRAPGDPAGASERTPGGPGHRRAGGVRRLDPRALLLVTFLTGALLAGVVTWLAAPRGDDAGTTASATGDRPATVSRSAPRTDAADATDAPSTSPTPADLARAERTQPLSELQAGDRVVYNANPCRFKEWVDGIDVALIACAGQGPAFQTRSEYLVPVEPAD